MTPETETPPQAAGRSGGEGYIITTRSHKNMSKSSTSNGGQGRGWCGCGGRRGHQGCLGRGGRFNLQAYMSSIWNFKGEVDSFGVVLGNIAYQRESKAQYKKFSNNMKQYVLW